MNQKSKETNRNNHTSYFTHHTSNHRGITLIALVITIIVMLILVSVIISMAVNGGLFGYAGRAAKETETEINKERDLANIPVNMTTDQLIEKFTGVEREWSIAWVYKNNAWSNPYFKDETLENSFDFSWTYGDDYGDIDTNYSITSEDELTGQLVVKLYTDGELNISGSGPIPRPWLGYYHEVGVSGGEAYEGYYEHGELRNYVNEHISSIVIGEGITSIPAIAFRWTEVETVSFPSTISYIDKTAFEQTPWIMNKLYEIGHENAFTSMYPEPPFPGTSYWCINVEINGKSYTLAMFVDD